MVDGRVSFHLATTMMMRKMPPGDYAKAAFNSVVDTYGGLDLSNIFPSNL